MRRVALTAGFLLTGSAALGQGLDAPVLERPTVRSEIKRGYRAGSVCDDSRIPAVKLDECIARISAAFRVNHAAPEAFETGLNLRKWSLAARYAKLGDLLPGHRSVAHSELYGKISARQAERDVKAACVELGITLDDAYQAAQISPEDQPTSFLSQSS